MSLVLHLSDIHLGTKDFVFADAKSEMVPLSERETRQSMLKRTLRKLGRALQKGGESLDSIFVTGDISYGGEEQGFKLFEAVFDELGEACPSRSRIIVIPGNHDVSRTMAPSVPEKYAFFQKYVRAKKFVVPTLDGIDIPNKAKTGKRRGRHYVLNMKEQWLALPINSANYCQVFEPIAPISDAEWVSFPAILPASRQEGARKTLENLRVNDAARISIEQFEALEEILQQAHEEIVHEGGDPAGFLKIALLHHHLLPVSTVEEVKKFESFTNLGLVRSFLAKHGFQIVLHGHKHIAKRYWDFIPRLDRDATSNPHRLLVISGGTLGQSFHSDEEVCRLIRFQSDPTARRVQVASISGSLPGHGIDSLVFEDFHLWDTDIGATCQGQKYITGHTASETYARVLAFFSQLGYAKERANVICEVADSTTAFRIPDRYPDVSGVQEHDRQAWFESLVDWWQLNQPTLSKTLQFTHGDHIFRNADQISNVIQVLIDKPSSSRAVVTLSRPDLDPIHDRKKKFPSFCLAQFIIRQPEGKSPQLDCVAYFRKQEMRFWWPINICELGRLQKRVLDGLPKKGFTENLIVGSLTTIAAIAKVGNTPPQVSVPIVDRSLDQAPDLLWTMSYALFWKEMPERKKYLSEWERVIGEFVPVAGFDPDGVPIPLEGLKELLKKTKQFASHHPSKSCSQLIRSMQNLHDENEHLVDALLQENEVTARRRFETWKPRAQTLAKEIWNSVQALFR